MEILHFHWINKFGIFLATIPNNLNTKTFISEYIELNINYLDQAVEYRKKTGWSFKESS